MANYQLVVFDWDGTLVDSEARIANAILATIADLQLEPRSYNQARDIIGLGLTEAIDRLYPGENSAFHQRMAERYRYHFLEVNTQPAQLFDGVEQTLHHLAGNGTLMAVATGKSRKGLARELEETGLEGYMVTSRCADESFSKPHPQMLLDVMEFAGVEPSETVMVGDTEYDMAMAQNAGVVAVAVTYGVHSRERMEPFQPATFIDKLSELTNWLHNR